MAENKRINKREKKYRKTTEIGRKMSKNNLKTENK